MLIIFMVVVLAVVIIMLVSGTTILPKKPVLAAFDADVMMGRNTASPALDVPVIRLKQMGGSDLIQNYTEGTHSPIAGTKMKILDPAGRMYTVVTANSMTGHEIGKGEEFYIFHYRVGEPDEYWITNDISRVTSSPGVLPFSPPGTWRLLITEEEDANMVIYQKDLVL
jgi:hypothetical protein